MTAHIQNIINIMITKQEMKTDVIVVVANINVSLLPFPVLK